MKSQCSSFSVDDATTDLTLECWTDRAKKIHHIDLIAFFRKEFRTGMKRGSPMRCLGQRKSTSCRSLTRRLGIT